MNIENDNTSEDNNQLIEQFNVNVELEKECKEFKRNQCPIKLGDDYMNFEGRKNFFKQARIRKLGYSPDLLCPIIIAIVSLFLTVFYLFIFLFSYDILSFIILVIQYIFSVLSQLLTFPDYEVYNTRGDFEDYLTKILNCSVKIFMKSGKKTIQVPADYTIDIIGEIDIPKDINFIAMSEIQIYINSNIKKFKEQAKKLYNNIEYSFVYKYDGQKFKCVPKIWMVNSNKLFSNIDCFDSILCILLLRWIRALYYRYSSFYNYVLIYPAKLVTQGDYIFSNTKINFQGHEFKSDNFTRVEINQKDSEEFEKDLEKKKKKEEKKRDKELNTFTLSDFSISRLYDLSVIREYNSVYAILEVDGYDRKRVYLGEMDPNIEEQIIKDETKEKVYIPKGINKKITVIISPYRLEFYIADVYFKFDKI